MYELIILSLLVRGATHGYVIAGVINDVVGPFARASNGRIYPLLTQLQKQRLISVHEEATSDGGRVSRSFAITGAGRARFRELMLDTSSNPREYRELFAFKVNAFDHIAPEERVRILDHYVHFADAHVRHLEAQAADLAAATTYGLSEAERRRFATVFGHLTAQWQREAEWARAMLAADTSKQARRARRPRSRTLTRR